jgi:tetratricopeptide (TPR) repeat protein
MARNNDLILNSVFLKNRVAELEIKQWWLAEQVGVDRKTVTRWLQGRVRAIQRANAEALAQVLDCQLNDLILESETDQLATADDQKNAAALIASSSLIEKLGPIGEWNVIEGLLKATIVPGLPLNILGELYNQLTVASWRQSKIDQAELYNARAEEIAIRSGDKAVLAGALLSKANLFSWRGRTAHAIRTYRECLALEKFIAKRTLGATYSNLGAVLYETGHLDEGETLIMKSIEIFENHGKPMNLSIAWGHISIVCLELGDLARAEDACRKAIEFAAQDDYRRGEQMELLVQAEISARMNRAEDARAALQKGLEGFARLGIEEGLNYEFAGRISRLIGDKSQAQAYLRKGIEISNEFPLYQAALNFEMAQALVAAGEGREARRFAEKAAELYTLCEAPLRAEAAKKFASSLG